MLDTAKIMERVFDLEGGRILLKVYRFRLFKQHSISAVIKTPLPLGVTVSVAGAVFT